MIEQKSAPHFGGRFSSLWCSCIELSSGICWTPPWSSEGVENLRHPSVKKFSESLDTVLSTAFTSKVVLRRYVCLVGIYCWAITQHLFFILSTSFHEKHKQITCSRVHSFGGNQNMQHGVTMNTRSIEERKRKGKTFVVLYHIALWGTALRADHNT